jgi:hypothetical protein
MDLRGQRLRLARKKRYKSARLAAQAMGIPVSTYGAHERAETPGARDYGPDEAKIYARRFGVTPEWLLTGQGAFQSTDEPPSPNVPVVGYVGAGGAAHLYDVASSHLDKITPATGIADNSAAMQVRGDSVGPYFNRWYVFYDDVRRPMTSAFIGQLCVIGLPDGRILIKQVQRGRREGLYNLHSATEKTIADAKIEWATRVNAFARSS